MKTRYSNGPGAVQTSKMTAAHIVSYLKDDWIIPFAKLTHVLADDGMQPVIGFFEPLRTFIETMNWRLSSTTHIQMDGHKGSISE